jgi:hypothetical protein
MAASKGDNMPTALSMYKQSIEAAHGQGLFQEQAFPNALLMHALSMNGTHISLNVVA